MNKTVTFKIWRGDANGGKFVDYTTEITEGLVVLDVVHKIQGDAGQRPRVPLELQSRQMRLLLGGNQRHSKIDVHDAHGYVEYRQADHD